MFKNYLKTTFRNLWKNKGFSFLNIFGLAIGIACASLIFLWIENELTYNDYFSNKENLYKIKDQQTYDGNTFTFDATPGPLAAGIKNDIPGIKKTARSTWGFDPALFSLGPKRIYEKGVYVDSSFFSMFQLKFIQGNPSNAFQQLYSLVITKKMAEKFFGSTEVLGKTLRVNNEQDYEITGVIDDLPENVSFNFQWLAPFRIMESKSPWLKNWGSNGILTYVETVPGANIAAINKKLYNYLQSKGPDYNAKFSLYPMNRWRMYDAWKDGKEIPGRIKYVNLFNLIAWIILIIACINFMNLSTARSEKRAREVGVRKVLGAGKGKLVIQFMGESLMLSLIASLVAVLIVFLCLPAFNALVEKELTLGLTNPFHIGALLLIALVCGIIAGSYPALYLSSFNPVTVLKGLRIKAGGSAGLVRKGLVVLQFAVSIILIVSTILIYQQIQHVKSRDLGYDKNGLIYTGVTGDMVNHFNVIKNDLIQTGVVADAALSRSNPLSLNSNTGDFSWPGKDPQKSVLITVESVSPQYLSTMGMKIKEGRDFYPDYKSDSNNIIINESLAKIIGAKDLIGSIITKGDEKLTVVGVIKNFIYSDMYKPAAPMILYVDTTSVNYLTMRLKGNTDVASALVSIQKVMKQDNPGYPFEYKFLDEEFNQFFKDETLIGKLAGIFSALAILISCLGLFGLAAYTAERRTKEIGIRKVVGASVSRIAVLLSKDFLKLVAVSCLIAFPLAWWIMQNWLSSYDYRITIHWTIFLFAGLLALFIALITVSFQAVKAAIANPVKSLKSE